jgi:2-methylcitrate dehydratase PrpD
VFVDPELDDMGPAFRHAARVVVTMTDGRQLKREILHRRGSPENAVDRQGIEEKFSSNVEALLEHGSIERLKQLAARLDHLPNANEIIGIMAAPLKNANVDVTHAASGVE